MDNLKNIPSVNDVKNCIGKAGGGILPSVLTDCIRVVTENFRQTLISAPFNLPLKESEEGAALLKKLADESLALAHKESKNNLIPVVNATGIVLHTNLGRAPLPGICASNVSLIAENYSCLEYDLETGERGSRYRAVEDLICRVTGAEAALVVNNNAAATLLILSALSKSGKKEVVVSRGELVEIGGSFRIPDILELGGAVLKETGTTNKTKVSDYENAVSKKTTAILKVHTSNYSVVGFTEDVGIKELCKVSKKNNLPWINLII